MIEYLGRGWKHKGKLLFMSREGEPDTFIVSLSAEPNYGSEQGGYIQIPFDIVGIDVQPEGLFIHTKEGDYLLSGHDWSDWCVSRIIYREKLTQ